MASYQRVSGDDQPAHGIGHKVDLGLWDLVFDRPNHWRRQEDVAKLAELNNEDFQAWQSPFLDAGFKATWAIKELQNRRRPILREGP